MKKVTALLFLGAVCALLLVLGFSGDAKAFDNGAGGRIILAGLGAGVDIGGVGGGVNIGGGGIGAGAHVGGLGAGANIGGPDPDRDRYAHKRVYHHHRAHKHAAKKPPVEKSEQ